MSSFTRRFLIAWFVVLLAIPGVTTVVSSRRTISNRAVTPAPAVDFGELRSGEYFAQFDSFLQDRLSIREPAIDWNARAAIDLFGDTANSDVHIGLDGWYFLTTVAEPCNQMRAGNWPTPTEVVDALDAFAGSLADRGADLYFAVVAEKVWVYPEYLDGDLASRDCAEQVLDPMFDRLREDDGYIDLFDAFVERARVDDGSLFLKTDTHWNEYGRAFATETVVEAIAPGLYDPGARVAGEEITISPSGDLVGLLGLNVDERDIAYSFERVGVTTEQLDASGRQTAWRSLSDTDADASFVPGRTVLVTDSHLNGTARLLAPWFENLSAIRWQDVGDDNVPDLIRNADRVIISISARFSGPRLKELSETLYGYLDR